MNIKNDTALFKFGLTLILLVCLSLNFLLIYISNFNNHEVVIFNNTTQEEEIIKFCSDFKDEANILSNTNFEPVTYTSSYKFIDAFPDIENLRCLKKVIEVWESDAENEFHFQYGTNIKIYEVLNLLINTLIVLLIIGLHIKNNNNNNLKFYGGGLFIYFNFVLNSIFQIDNNLISIFTNYNTFVLVISVGLLFVQLIYKNSSIFIGSLFFYIIFIYEFFGIFIVIC